MIFATWAKLVTVILGGRSIDQPRYDDLFSFAVLSEWDCLDLSEVGMIDKMSWKPAVTRCPLQKLQFTNGFH